MSQSTALFDRAYAPPRARLTGQGLGIVLGVWLGLYPFVDLLLRPRMGLLGLSASAPAYESSRTSIAYVAIVAASICPAIWSAFAFGVDFRRAKLLLLAAALYCLSMPLSLFGANSFEALVYIALTDYLFACLILLLSANIDGEAMMRSLFSTAAVTLGVAGAAALIDHDFAWGRLMGHMQPNYWGGLGGLTILTAFAFRGWIPKAVLIGLGLLVMYFAQSRSILVSLSAALALAGLLYAHGRRGHGSRNWIWLSLWVGLAAVLAIAFGHQFIIDKVFLVSDPLRGAGSGLTGRTSSWRDGWDQFASHPWLGVGYQQSYQQSGLVIHNAYLLTLGDTGIVGLFGYLIFLFGAFGRALVAAWRNPSPARVIMASVLLMTIVSDFMEPGGQHLGNSGSMISILVAAWAWRTDPRWRSWRPPSPSGRQQRPAFGRPSS